MSRLKRDIAVKGKIKKLAQIKKIKIGHTSEYEVVDQPRARKSFVSEKPNALTNFRTPHKHGVYGFLAHNFLAGKRFFGLKAGQMITITADDGIQHSYKISNIQKYQAVDPASQRSDFIDLKDKKRYSANDLFKRVYMGGHHLVLQTCIARDGNEEWGRLFVIAEPDDK